MKKVITLVLAMFVLTSCTSNRKESDKNLTIGGSTSVQPLMEKISDTYNKKNNASTSVQGGGSSVGIKGAQDGTFQIGMSSRELSDDESKSLTVTTIAVDGIVIVVNLENPVKNLSLKQISEIFTGKITNWKQVGGDDREIEVVSREEGSGTRDGFESIVGFKTTELVEYSQIQNATGAVLNAIRGNKGAIGYVSMGSVSDSVKVLDVEHVKPTKQNIENGSYKIQRPFIIISKKGDKHTEAFNSFIFSKEGQQLIIDNKYIPVKRK